MYIFFAYQSPWRGTACGPQCAQKPSLASRNHSGYRYCLSDSSVGLNGPGEIARSAFCAFAVTNNDEVTSAVKISFFIFGICFKSVNCCFLNHRSADDTQAI